MSIKFIFLNPSGYFSALSGLLAAFIHFPLFGSWLLAHLEPMHNLLFSVLRSQGNLSCFFVFFQDHLVY